MRDLIRSCVIAVAIALAFVTGAYAQSFPAAPIRFVVPFAAGGATDVVARVIAEGMGKALGQQTFVENRPGGLGLVAANHVARSKPDGYTLLVANLDVALGSIRKELTPVGMIAKGPLVIVARDGSSLKELKDLIAQQVPVARIGLSATFALTRLEKATGAKFARPAFGGAQPALNAIAAGTIEAGIVPLSTIAAENLSSLKLKALAVTSEKRSPLLPDVPTVGELGISKAILEQWTGLLAPVGTPADVITKLNAALLATLNRPDVANQLTRIGFQPSPTSPDGFVISVNASAGIPICGNPCPAECKDGCEADCCLEQY